MEGNLPGTPVTAQKPPLPPAATQPVSKIQHTRPGIGIGGVVPAPGPMAPLDGNIAVSPPGIEKTSLPVAESMGMLQTRGKFTAFGKDRRHEDSWSRTPNTTGSGAIHVKTFHCKLTEDALSYMDQTINEWLDAHPQYEVKFVSSTIGTLTGKLKEPALFCQVWV